MQLSVYMLLSADRALAAALPRLGLHVKSQAAGLTGDPLWQPAFMPPVALLALLQ